MVPEVNAQWLKQNLLGVKVIDVRRPDEFTGELGHIDGARLVTLETDLVQYLESLPKDQEYVFVCKSGGRSGMATSMALTKGFQKVFNLTGGMLEWNRCGFPVNR